MTMRLCSSAIFAIPSSSARANTFPTGLCGVFSTIIFVFGVTARLGGQDQYLACSVRPCGWLGRNLPQFVKVDRP